MPKAEKGSVKDIAKRIKAKGLQKLKFYCQICEKQCRDANGFKCHIQSDSHLRQMKLFSENASGRMDQYSREFEKVFLDTLRMLHGTAQVNANQVYQQVIRDKQHIHMNATIWATLKDFCQYLGKTGKCRVEETERGWYITYINRNVESLLRQQQAQERQEAALQAEAQYQKQLDERKRQEASMALEKAGVLQQQPTTNMAERAHHETIHIQKDKLVLAGAQSNKKATTKRAVIHNVLDTGSDDDDDEEHDMEKEELENAAVAKDLSTNKRLLTPKDTTTTTTSSSSRKRPRHSSATAPEKGFDQPAQREPNQQQEPQPQPSAQRQRDPSVWLYRDIVVRIIDQTYRGGRYFRRKAYVDRVILPDNDNDNKDSSKQQQSQPLAELTLLRDSNQDDDEKDDVIVLRLAQDCLETVVPKQADTLMTTSSNSSSKNKHKQSKSRVRILVGPYRGKKAVVVALNKPNYQGRLQLDNGTILESMPFEHFALLA